LLQPGSACVPGSKLITAAIGCEAAFASVRTDHDEGRALPASSDVDGVLRALDAAGTRRIGGTLHYFP
jgi:hypothetical protein